MAKINENLPTRKRQNASLPPGITASAGQFHSKNIPVAVRSATSRGSFGAVYVLTSTGAKLWSRAELRRGRHDDQLREVRKGLLDADALGSLVRHAERAASEFGVYVENRRAA